MIDDDRIQLFLANLRGEICAQIADTAERMRALSLVDSVAARNGFSIAYGTTACPVCGSSEQHSADSHVVGS